MKDDHFDFCIAMADSLEQSALRMRDDSYLQKLLNEQVQYYLRESCLAPLRTIIA